MDKETGLVEVGSLYRMVMEESRDGIVILDAGCAVRAVNTAFASLLGFSTEEVQRMYPRDWDAQFSRDDMVAMSAGHRCGQHIFHAKVRRKDNVLCDLEINSTRIDYRGAEHFFCICRPITECKPAPPTLSDGETLYGAIFNLSPDGVVVIDAATHAYLDFNDAACQSHGYSREEFSRLTTFDINADLSQEEVIRRAQEIRERGQATFETLHRHKDGSLLNVRVSLRAVRLQGKDVLVGFWTDLTHSKLLEEQLRQSQKMEAVGQLAGGIAHDFNNVLTAIVGFAHIIDRKLEEDSPLRPTLQHILRSAQRAAGLTGDLLTFSRKKVLDLRPIRLNDALRRTEKILGRLTREDITLSVSCCPHPLTVLGDESQLTQILMNLTTNARDAMPHGGLISISTSPLRMDREFVGRHGYGHPGDFALITFADTGCGMDEETRKKIFDPFFTTKAVGKGTGLGLAMVYGVVKQLGGFINVYSEPGVGTVFRIYLPQCLTEALTPEKEPEKGEVPGGHETILLAEDDPSVRELEEALLREAGYQVLTASDGAQALELFQARGEGIDLLVLDAIMPGKNGVEVLRQALQMRPAVKAILLSGYTSDHMALDAVSKEAATLIQKPVDPRLFLQTVREVLDRR